MSIPGLPQEVYEVPLHSKDSSRGVIRYHGSKEMLDKVPGFFSFTFYFPDTVTSAFSLDKGQTIYLEGLREYLDLIKEVPEFQGWHVLVYTDAVSLQKLITSLMTPEPDRKTFNGREQHAIWRVIHDLYKNLDALTFVTVEWPNHYPRPKVPQVSGPVLRPLRSRTPFDFPNAMVFIRDADTLFEEQLKEGFGGFSETLRKWEVTFLQQIPELQAFKGTPSLLIVGTGGNAGIISRIYHRDWHENELEKKKSPFGVFAGFVNVTPGLPVYQTKDAWDEFVDYVDKRSVRQMNKPMNPVVRKYLKTYKTKSYPVSSENLEKYIKQESKYGNNAVLEEQTLRKQLTNIFYPFSNDGTAHSIGRDEQLYLFILMPRALDNLVLFKVTLGEPDDLPYWTDPKEKASNNYSQPQHRADYHTRLFDAYKKTLESGFQTISKVKLPPPTNQNDYTWNEMKKHQNFLEYNTPMNDPMAPRPGTPQPTNGNNPVVSGGKRRARKTKRGPLRSKIEKRKTRKHR